MKTKKQKPELFDKRHSSPLLRERIANDFFKKHGVKLYTIIDDENNTK